MNYFHLLFFFTYFEPSIIAHALVPRPVCIPLIMKKKRKKSKLRRKLVRFTKNMFRNTLSL